MSAEVPIVDANDEIIGHSLRGEVARGQIYRITTLTIVNSIGDILVAQRSLSKQNDPGRWGPAVAGTVERDETYASNIRKEAAEELGLSNIFPEPGPKLYVADNGHGRGYFCQMYTAVVDLQADSFALQAEEVASVKWVRPAWLIDDVNQNPDKYTINFAEGLRLILPYIATEH